MLDRIETIRKRDGRIVPYDREKIRIAIGKALSVDEMQSEPESAAELAKMVEERLLQTLVDGEIPTVERIQDAVEVILMKQTYPAIAKSYILHRDKRTRAREANSSLMKLYRDMTFKSSRDCDTKRENANVNADTAMGMMLKYGSEGAKYFNISNMIKPEYSEAHTAGDIHIHDLDFYTLTLTCCQIDLIRLFEGGFATGHGSLREPNDISSYAALACIAIQSNQNDQHGGQSIVNFDYAMAQGVAKTYAKLYKKHLIENMCHSYSHLSRESYEDLSRRIGEALADIAPKMGDGESELLEERMCLEAADLLQVSEVAETQRYCRMLALKDTERATYQAMEALVHNLNTMHSRAGAQTPFSSINYGMDTSPEGRLAIRSILLATEAGLGHGETPIFPIHVFRVKKGVNFDEGDPNYDLFKLACRVSSKRLFPNFSFLDAPFNARYYKEGHPETEIAYMGCRTRVIGNIHDSSREISYSRGNLSFTSINLPRLAIEAKGDMSAFFKSLDERIDLVIGQLLERFAIQSKLKVKNFPFLMGQGVWLDSEKLKWEDEIKEVIKHGSLSIGFIGLAEALKSLIGSHHGESEVAQKLGIEIISHMRKRVDAAADFHRLNFTLLATPAEGLSGRFVMLDRERFGVIEGVTDKDYYTNSFHVPVYYKVSAARKILTEAPYHELTNAGHITYVELDGDTANNPEAFESIVKFMADHGIGYGSINHPVDRDPVCGYNGIIGDKCPKCGRSEADGPQFERIRRITGYLVGTLDRWGDGKRAEERDRVKHGI